MMNTNAAGIIGQSRVLLILSLVFTANLSVAAPQIVIEFEQEQGSNNEWIHAKANCLSTEPPILKVLNAVVKYPELHSWIQNTKLESEPASGEQQFLVEFKFPWPVGKQWSRIEVKKHSNSTISWRQLEGTLKTNKGRIEITEYNQQAHLDYRAIIDVGYPSAFTRGYKKQFVSEFLRAIYEETIKMQAMGSEHSFL